MTTTCLPVPVLAQHSSTRPASVVPAVLRRIGRAVAALRTRVIDYRSTPTISERVLADIDVPHDLHR